MKKGASKREQHNLGLSDLEVTSLSYIAHYAFLKKLHGAPFPLFIFTRGLKSLSTFHFEVTRSNTDLSAIENTVLFVITTKERTLLFT